VVPVILNAYSIVYLANREWSMMSKGGEVIYETTDAVGNPVILRLTMNRGSIEELKITFRYLEREFEAIYPVPNVDKAGDEPLLAEVASRIGGALCTVRIGGVEYVAACKPVKSAHMVVKPTNPRGPSPGDAASAGIPGDPPPPATVRVIFKYAIQAPSRDLGGIPEELRGMISRVEGELGRLRQLIRSLPLTLDPLNLLMHVKDPLLVRLISDELGGEVAVAYLGPEGTFSHEASLALFGKSMLGLPAGSAEEVVRAVSIGRATYGVIPIENNLAGIVGDSVDALLRWDVGVRLSVEYRVVLCLVSSGVVDSVGAVRRVYSHQHALNEAREFLGRLNVELVQTRSTAEALERIRYDEQGAAVASRLGAELRGMRMLVCGIEDRPNYTRFLVVGRGFGKRGVRTMGIFSVPNKPGALHEALGPFAQLGVNLTMIYSKPNRTGPWEYDFVLEAQCQLEDEACSRAFEELRNRSTYIRILGSYNHTRI
jgi:prephenate dehydratase